MKELRHEYSFYMGKDTFSQNKQRLLRLANDLDRLSNNHQISNYEAMENTFKELQKVLEQRREADLHVLRQSKFIPTLMEILNKINVCPKNEINDFIRLSLIE